MQKKVAGLLHCEIITLKIKNPEARVSTCRRTCRREVGRRRKREKGGRECVTALNREVFKYWNE